MKTLKKAIDPHFPGGRRAVIAVVVAVAALCATPPAAWGVRELPDRARYRSPLHIAFSPDGKRAYVVNHTGASISVIDVASREVVKEIPAPDYPVTAVAGPGGILFVTSRYENAVFPVDPDRGIAGRALGTGYEPYGIAYAPKRNELYVANNISGTVQAMDPETGEIRFTVPVGREPRYLALSPDESFLITGGGLSRKATIIHVATGAIVEQRDLDRASLLRYFALTPDGRYAFVAHVVSHDEHKTSQMERGWIHANGFTVMDMEKPGHRVTLLLDHLLDGAANPWGLALSPDGARLYVTLAGVHQVAVVDVEKALALVSETRTSEQVVALQRDVEILRKRGIARRVRAGGEGPRGVVYHPDRNEVWVANYFSDSISILDPEGVLLETVFLDPSGRSPEPDLRRRGEMLVNDANLCFQRWFSCASCHQEDATMDGLNWDLANDGFGNPKNAKSLHDVVDTPPAMWTGVRKDMNAAVAAGQRFLGFLPTPDQHRALVIFLGDPPRAPNPYRNENPGARTRGEKIFNRADCNRCHIPPTFEDGKLYDLGLKGPNDFRTAFDTPTLREIYRTAPYLHDGRAKTLEDIFRKHNPDDRHGITNNLSDEELADLIAYIKGL